MTDSEKQDLGAEELEAPGRLREDLAALYGAPVRVPPEVDEAVVAMARQRLSPRRRQWRLRRWLAAGAAVAAVVLLVFSVWPHRRLPPGPSVADSAPTMDLDGSGRVDVLDAFLLARYLATSQALPEEWDVDQDGTVDQQDVTGIVMSAVRLDGGTL